ncbi:DNA replication and repair protein RecF [Candidatus Parcubacteria bacterium]|nr:DNA replication and repair protein RecF [Candidatus Parcubacteria bacterium]
MIFTDIRLQNFRSYRDSSFELSSGVTIVVGPNAAGKTNLLEAIMVSAIGKSYRAKPQALVMASQLWSRLDVHTIDNSLRTTKIVTSQENTSEKTHEINGKPYKRLPLNNQQPVVLFEPNNLIILQGEPPARRDYIDNLLEQVRPGFAKIRADYKRTLAQRNALLKTPDPESKIFVWDVRLSELAGQLTEARLEIIELINQNLQDIYSEIAGKTTKLNTGYKTEILPDNYASAILKKLQADIDKDKRLGFTTTGPHRDDIKIEISGHAINTFSSRGESRSALLALKIIELKLLEEARKTKPTLLLDDVFSELDGARRKHLTSFLKPYQTIITTTDADVVIKHFTANCTIIPLGAES